MTVRLEPQAEPRCGYDVAAALALNRMHGMSLAEDIMQGLILPRAAEMALRAPIDPLTLALTVRDEIFFGPARLILAYQRALERVNADIIEKGRLLHNEKRAAQRTAQGTRSTRRHGKKGAGR